MDDYTELFDKYLQEELSTEQKKTFDARLANDPDFSQEFEAHKLVVQLLVEQRQFKVAKAEIEELAASVAEKNNRYIDQFDDYLAAELPNAERTELEQAVEQSPLLQEELNAHKLIVDAVLYEKNRQFIESIKNSSAQTGGAKVVALPFWQNKQILAIAASVAIFMMAIIGIVQYNRSPQAELVAEQVLEVNVDNSGMGYAEGKASTKIPVKLFVHYAPLAYQVVVQKGETAIHVFFEEKKSVAETVELNYNPSSEAYTMNLNGTSYAIQLSPTEEKVLLQ